MDLGGCRCVCVWGGGGMRWRGLVMTREGVSEGGEGEQMQLIRLCITSTFYSVTRRKG